MKRGGFGRAERGVALVVGLIMLLLITLLVSSAFSLSTVNLKSVGNMQVRDEALAAANTAIELVMSGNFTAAPAASASNVDINNDGVADYVVNIATPQCIRHTLAQAADPSSETLSGLSSNTWNTVWALNATVLDPGSGTVARVRSGVRVLLTDAQKNAVCP